jgi:hypothetical protein
MADPKPSLSLWRSQTSTRTSASATTTGGRLLVLILLAAVGVAALFVVLLAWLHPAPRPDFLPLWILPDRDAADFLWAEQDCKALRTGGYFADRGPKSDFRLDAAALLHQLDTLKQSHNAVVVYLAGHALRAEDKVYVLPADATPDKPAGWLPLQQILIRLRDGSARHKLLVLDLTGPGVAAAIPTELQAVEDPDRLALCACGPGETPLVSEDLGRSVFNFYLEEGLRGWADGYGVDGRRDGRITVHELAAFCQARVDRWARRNRNARQTPTLYGTGPDFVLLALEHGQPAEAHEPPSPRAYPEWLFKAWKERDDWRAGQKHLVAPQPYRELEAAGFQAERAWRGGGNAEIIQDRRLSRLALLQRQLELLEKLPRPRPASLALAAAFGEKTEESLVVALRDLLGRVRLQTQGLKAVDAGKVRASLLGEFQEKSLAKVSDFALAWAVFEAAATDPEPSVETVRALDQILRARQPRPQYVETLLLRGLAEAPRPWQPVTAHHCLRAVGLGQKAATQPASFSFVAGRVEDAFQKAHDGQVRFWARGYASPIEADEPLAAAGRELEAVLPQQESLLKAQALRDEAWSWLPAYLGYLGTHTPQEKLWLNAVRLTRKLADLLDQKTYSPADVQELVPRLALDLETLRQPFDSARVKRLSQRSREDSPDANLFLEMEALLATPLLDAESRRALWNACRELGRRLNERTRQLDHQEDETRQQTPAAPEYDRQLAQAAVRERELRRVRVAQTLREMPPAPPGSTRSEQSRALWTWLAGQYRYAARDWANLRLPWPADASPEIFFGEAASAYQAAADPAPESYLQIASGQADTARSSLRLRAVGPRPLKGVTPLPVRMLLPGTDWLRVTPAMATAELPPGITETSLPIQVEKLSGGDRSPPRGFLVEARYLGRNFHHKVPVPFPGQASQVEFLLGSSPKDPEPALPEIRLRAGKFRQAFYLFARNLTDQPKNVLVEVKDQSGPVKGGEVKLALGPGETQRIRLGPMLPPVLPEFQGPISLRALDADKQNAVLGQRTVPVGIAAPREYVRVVARSFDPPGPKTGGKNKLTVKLEGVVPFPGPAIPVEMVLPARRIPGLLGAKDGTFRGELPAKEKGPAPTLTLFAEGIQLDESADEEGYFYLNVDGFDRAFVFRTTFARRGAATTPRPDGRPAIRVITDRFALASSKWDVVLEVDNAPADASLEVSVGQFQGQQFQADLVRKLPGPRQTMIGFTPQGPDGAWVFEAGLKDWAVPLDISGIKGPRLVRARLLDADGGVIQTVVQPIYSDATPPERVHFIEPPTQAKKGSRLALRATGIDPESGIQRVVFFLGRPQGDKIPDKTTTVEGTLVKGTKATWAVAFPLPDLKGPADISIQFVNGVGLSRFDTASIELLDTDPRLTGPGKIRGTVREGPRPQEGLEVLLKDPKGNVLAKAKTGPDGIFEFAPVAPGNYVVYSAKSESQRRGSTPAKVEPNQTAKVTVELELP